MMGLQGKRHNNAVHIGVAQECSSDQIRTPPTPADWTLKERWPLPPPHPPARVLMSRPVGMHLYGAREPAETIAKLFAGSSLSTLAKK